MKKLLSYMALGLMAWPTAMAVNVIKPTVSTPTEFAIIIDDATLENTRPAVMAYRQAVEDDGLATWIVSGQWSDPMAVRQSIQDLYGKSPNLEGIVLVGDIPVALVRNAQHMTTAFKMNEKAFPWPDSSVPTDRFYDDLNLKFEYLRADSVNPQHFYYLLSDESPQKLNPTFYSARIKYPEKKGGDKYKAISDFLYKAANAKAEMKGNKVDEVFSFNGDSYNSDCLVVWMDDEKAYRENFPLAFGRKMGFKHWNFRMQHPMKPRLLNELRRADVDVFMFHEHGMPTGQLINGEMICDGFDDRYEMLKSTLYNSVVGHASAKHPRDTMQMQMQQKRQVNAKFFADLDNPEWWEKDSLHYSNEHITTQDFMDGNLVSNPRMMMFDACYNGSFHEDDYMAAHYIFNPGQTLVAQGNTRNVLQDRWTIEMLGLLSHGMRVGQYNRMIASLEGHLLGDPTVRFAPIYENTLSQDVTTRKTDKQYWQSLLDSDYADVQSLALRMLADADTDKTMAPMLLDVVRNSQFNTVRMEALKLLSRYKDENFVEALVIGLNDPYEMVARQSAIYAGFNGDDQLLVPLVKALIDDNERMRVQSSCNKALQLYPRAQVKKVVDDFYATANRMDAEQEKARLMRSLERTFDSDAKNHAILMDKSASEAKRIAAIRMVRNYPFHFHVNDYLGVVADAENPAEVRTVMAEALGWFTNSCVRQNILDGLQKIGKTGEADLDNEITQTIIRLSL